MDLTRELALGSGCRGQIASLGEDLLGVGVGSGFDHVASIGHGRVVWAVGCARESGGTQHPFDVPFNVQDGTAIRCRGGRGDNGASRMLPDTVLVGSLEGEPVGCHDRGDVVSGHVV